MAIQIQAQTQTQTPSRTRSFLRGALHAIGSAIRPQTNRAFRIKTGAIVTLPVRSKSARELASGIEPLEFSFVRQLLRPGDTFVDIGAHCGLMSIIASEAVGPYGNVYAFEPGNLQSTLLQANLAQNRIVNVKLVRKAIGNSVGSVSFQNAPDTSSSALTVEDPDDDAGESVTSIQSTTLDQFIGREGMHKARLINIDVEGAETLVLQGAGKLLMNHDAPVLIIHVDDTKSERFESSVQQIKAMLTSYGFSCYEMSRHVGPVDRVSLSYSPKREAYEDIVLVAAKDNNGHSALR
jgi:FkbM family methyltransferase